MVVVVVASTDITKVCWIFSHLGASTALAFFDLSVLVLGCPNLSWKLPTLKAVPPKVESAFTAADRPPQVPLSEFADNLI